GNGLVCLVGLLIGLSGMLIGRVGLVHGIAGMLVGGGRLLLGRADAALRPFIDLLYLVTGVGDLCRILIGLFTNLIYFGLNWRCGIADVLFGSAAPSHQGAGQNARGREQSFHSSKTSVDHVQSSCRFLIRACNPVRQSKVIALPQGPKPDTL